MAIDRNKGVQWACAPNVNVSIFAKGANVVGGSWGSVYRGPFGSGMVKQLKDWDYGYNYDPDHTLPYDETYLFYTCLS